MNNGVKSRVKLVSGLLLLAAVPLVGCQRVDTQRVAFEHNGVTLAPERFDARLVATETRTRQSTDRATALRLAALGITLD